MVFILIMLINYTNILVIYYCYYFIVQFVLSKNIVKKPDLYIFFKSLPPFYQYILLMNFVDA